jgi:surface polysaccharide O-acyltransferase-like enzyme
MSSAPIVISPRLSLHLDFIRLFAMIGVVFLHTASGFLFRPDLVLSKIWFPLSFLYAFALPCVFLFFTLSGFLTLARPAAIKDNLLKTFWRLIFPLLVFILLGGLLQYFGLQRSQSLPTSLYLYLSGLMSGNLWFLFVISGIYLFRPLFSLVRGKQLWQYLFLVCFALSFLLHLIFLRHDPAAPANFATFTNIFACLGFYFFGAWCRRVDLARSPNKTTLLKLALSILVLVALNIFFNRQQMLITYFSAPSSTLFNIAYNFWIAFASILLSFALWFLFFNFDFISPQSAALVKKLSALSFGVYLLHTLVINARYYFTSLEYDIAGFNIYQYVLLNFFGVLGLSFLLSFLLSKIPFVRKTIGL